ncbi:zinc finger MYM-type protein 5-like [Palaemon carinicauda]|uniref:zinc finger MYM-type protein 5-like n=1 Tax=Palaemon carinicauda TaxID=392227 RepID=UPI0035B62600
MASRERDVGRSYASGSQKRNKKIQEEQKKKDVGSCRKITDMLKKTVSDVTSTVESADTSDNTGRPPSIVLQPASTSFVSPLNVMDISSTGFVLKDHASWPNVIPDSLRNAFTAENFIQTLNIDFRKSARIYDDRNRRCLKSSMFYRKLANSETVKRSWIVYSESSGKVYCSACKLFSTKENAFTQGFNDVLRNMKTAPLTGAAF